MYRFFYIKTLTNFPILRTNNRFNCIYAILNFFFLDYNGKVKANDKTKTYQQKKFLQYILTDSQCGEK